MKKLIMLIFAGFTLGACASASYPATAAEKPNILILGGRVVGTGLATEIVKTWMNTPFKGGRHQRRLDKIDQIDEMIQKGEI